MGNLVDLNIYHEDMDAVNGLADDLYNKLFASNFSQVQNIYRRMKSNDSPITDEELEYVITMLPLELFEVSEGVNRIRLDLEVAKLKKKGDIPDIRDQLRSEAEFGRMNKTATAQYIQDRLPKMTLASDILIAIYSSIISRVERESTFAKELIMGAKKVWDSRRSAEQSSPIGPTDVDDLPDYKPDSKTYIK